MDYSSFDKPKLWLNIAGFLFCGVTGAYLLFEGGAAHRDYFGALLFLIFAVNCLFRIFSYFKLDRIRKNASSEEEIIRAERRQGLVISIFSNAMFLLFILLLFIRSITKPLPVGFSFFCGAIMLIIALTLVLSVRNLRRIDRM